MKNYLVVIVQLMIWSGYTLTEWLSKHDQALYNILMFLVFIYIASIAGNYIVQSKRKTFFLTMLSLFIYGMIHFALNYF